MAQISETALKNLCRHYATAMDRFIDNLVVKELDGEAIRILKEIYCIETAVDSDGNVYFPGSARLCNLCRLSEGKEPVAKEIQRLMKAAEQEIKQSRYKTD